MSEGAPPTPPESEPPPWWHLHLWQITPLRDVLWIVLVGFLLWFAYFLRGIFTPVLVALVLAYLFHPLLERSERRWRLPRPLTVAALVTTLIVVTTGLISWFGPLFVTQVTELASSAPTYLSDLAAEYDLKTGNIKQEVQKVATQMQEDAVGLILDNVRRLLAGTSRAAGIIGTIIGTGTYIAIVGVLIPTFFVVFSLWMDNIIAFFDQFLPESRRAEARRIIGEMDRTVSAFFRGRVIVALLLGVLMTVAWNPWLADVPYYLLLGPLAGLLSIIPYAAVLAWMLALSLKALELGAIDGGINLWDVVLWPTIAYGVVQFLEGWFLTPWIQGRELDLHAVTVLLVVLIGGAVGGLFGLLLCVPIAACGKILLNEVVVPRARRWAQEH